MSKNKQNIKNEISRTYLSKDFGGLRSDLQRFAQTYYPDNMQDFSESSLGGLLIDLAAYVGDTMSFYTDHQFRELDPTTAVESLNIEKMAQNAGIKIPGAAPAVAEVKFYLRIPAIQVNGEFMPDHGVLPIIQENTELRSSLGIDFFLIEDLDFSLRDPIGNYVAEISSLVQRGSENFFIMARTGTCVSGKLETENFTISNNYVAFRTINLTNSDVSTILRVTDSEGNDYYEVESLSQDTVFKSFPNNNRSVDGVQSQIAIVPAPYRFTANADARTRMTRLTFGSGKATNLADDGVPDPGSLSLPLYGRKSMSRFSLDPALLLNTKTMGISPQNTTISVTYRHGGGSSHNVPISSIDQVTGLKIKFRDSTSSSIGIDIRGSLEVENLQPGAGGADRPSMEDIRGIIPGARNLQSRIVTREDLLSRLYTLPNEYGRIYRAGIVASPTNPLSSLLFVVSKNSAGKLDLAPDILKKNISKYLNEFRLISDAIDVLDVRIINYRVSISIIAAPNANKMLVSKTVLDKVKALLKTEKFQIGQPIIESDIINTIINTPGVLSLVELRLDNLTGQIQGMGYSSEALDFTAAKQNGIYFCRASDIFELRYPDEDINVTIR
jgi:hypothetical protein